MPNPRRRIPLAPIAAMAVVVAVFAGTVAAIAWRARSALQEQVLRREGETIYSVALLQVGSTSAKLTDFGAADSTEDLFTTVLETSRLRGVIAVRLFDAQGGQRAALPATDPIRLGAAALAQMGRHEPIVRFFAEGDLAIALGMAPGSLDTAPAPLLQVTVPLHPQEKPGLLGAAQYWIDGSSVAEEFAQIDRQLRLQATAAIAGGTVLLILVLAWAYRQLARRREDLVRANRELAMMAKTSALGAISAHLIHDLKNPLAGLEGFVRDEAAGASDEAEPAWDEAVQTARRLRGMVADVTALLRDEAEGAFTPLTLAEVGDAAGRRVAATAAQHAVTLKTMVGKDGERVVAGREANLAVLILANLLDNACKASPSGAEVLLTAHCRNQELEFLVTDHGTGLPEAMQKELFQPKRTARPGGSGLGLAISHQLARHVGGTIELVRTGPTGTEFRLRIPTPE